MFFEDTSHAAHSVSVFSFEQEQALLRAESCADQMV